MGRDELAQVIAGLAKLDAPDVGGLHQTLSAEADDGVWLLAVCERGPELEVAGPVKRQQVHLVRQRVRLQGNEPSAEAPR